MPSQQSIVGVKGVEEGRNDSQSQHQRPVIVAALPKCERRYLRSCQHILCPCLWHAGLNEAMKVWHVPGERVPVKT